MASRIFSPEEVVSILLNDDENDADDTEILAEGSDEEFEDITEYDCGR